MKAVRAEWVKLRTTRTMWAITASAVAVSLGIALLVLLFGTGDDSGEAGFDLANRIDRISLLQFASFSAIFGSVMGVLGIGSEYRHGTATPTFLAVPSRVRVMLAKLVVYLLYGLLLTVVTLVLVSALVALFVSIDGESHDFGDSLFWAVAAGTLVYGALAAALGVGVGAVLKQPAAAIVVLLAFQLIVETILLSTVPEVGRWAPFTLGNWLVGISGESGADPEEIVDRVTAGVALTGYVVLFGLIGTWLVRRRDVSGQS